jgi:PKHD-type hydroxylase
MIFEIDLLDNDQLYFVNKLYKHLEFEDGSKSNTGLAAEGRKKCLTSYGGNINNQLQDYLQPIIGEKVGWNICMNNATPFYFSKFNKGDLYDWHIDSVPIRGIIPHYSMTCFLNDDYEGGELKIRVGDSVIDYKMQPGKAVVYPTEYYHTVRPIISGQRRVFCTWIQSGISDYFLRNQYVHICRFMRKWEDEISTEMGVDINQIRFDILRHALK